MFFWEFSFGCFISTGHFKNIDVTVIFGFVGFFLIDFFNLKFSSYLSIIVAEKKLKPNMGQFFSHLQPRLSFRVLHSVILSDSASVLSLTFSSLSICLYKLLGATAVVERVLVRIRVHNRYTGQNEMH